jgi:hypothetical protein
VARSSAAAHANPNDRVQRFPVDRFGVATKSGIGAKNDAKRAMKRKLTSSLNKKANESVRASAGPAPRPVEHQHVVEGVAIGVEHLHVVEGVGPVQRGRVPAIGVEH